MNSITLLGRIGRDPENRSRTENMMITFSLAVDDGKEKDGTKKTIWFDCTAWDKTGEVILNYVKKGDQILIEGRFAGAATYETQKGPGISNRVTVTRVHLLSGNRNQDNAQTQGQGPGPKPSANNSKPKGPGPGQNAQPFPVPDEDWSKAQPEEDEETPF